jgi:hypothetical protein
MAFVPTEELAFRSQPNIAPETLIRRIPVTEQLICLEPANFAIAKVGVVGQWLKVRDQQNKEGFVAAWYVKYASGSTAQDPAASQPADTGKVKATAQAVAFRKHRPHRSKSTSSTSPSRSRTKVLQPLAAHFRLAPFTSAASP